MKKQKKVTRKRKSPRIKTRAYDIAKTFTSSDWSSTSKKSANEEIKSAIAPGREKARALVQNFPYAGKAIDTIVTETVGSGIVPNIKGKDEITTKKLKDLWKSWAETTECDFYDQHNIYGLQELILRTTVESGEGLTLKLLSKESLKLQVIESDFIATTKDSGNVVQGIELDPSGKPSKYHLYKIHPGSSNASEETKTINVKDLSHVYRKKRPGQLRGVTWAHSVIEKCKDFDDFEYATLVRQKIAACFGGVITTNGDVGPSNESTKSKREKQFEMEPNTWKYLAPGESMQLISPPDFDGSNFNRNVLRAIASGWGISYESLTGDYSQSNYSSSRLGQTQMKKNIESWRWNMFIPMFCDKVAKWFLEYAALNGIKTEGASFEWVPPALSLIDPVKEISALKAEVRAGFKSYKQALLELGLDPESTLKEIEEYNKKFDDMGISLDIDPRKMSQVGLAQTEQTNDNEVKSGEKTDKKSTDEPNSGAD